MTATNTIWLFRVYDKGHPADCDCGECYSVVFACDRCLSDDMHWHEVASQSGYGDVDDDFVEDPEVQVDDDDCDFCDGSPS